MVSIGLKVWSQLTSVSDRQTDRRTKLVQHKDDRPASIPKLTVTYLYCIVINIKKQKYTVICKECISDLVTSTTPVFQWIYSRTILNRPLTIMIETF